jgi:uncharacterized protein (DUF2345 family)
MSRKPIANLVDSFKLFVDKFNILSNNVGDPSQLNTYQDSDLVTVLNEIEATFDASAGEIIYPNGQDGETSTHLKISTNQSSGQDIDIDAGRDFLVDAVADIELTGVNFEGDYSGTYINKVDGTSLDSVGGSITVTGNSTYTLTTGSNFIQNTTGNIDMSASGNFIFDALGDITLDADGNQFYFKNGAGGDTQTHTFYDGGDYHIQTPDNYQIETLGSGTITLDASGEDIIMKGGIIDDGGGARPSVTHNIATGTGEVGQYTITAPSDVTIDAVGDIILDADGNDIVLRNGGGGDSAQINLADNADLTITAPDDVVIDAENDIVLDANGANITLKRDGTTRVNYILDATNTIGITGNLDQNVSGDHSDSANGTYHIGATGNFDINTLGTFDIVSGGAYGVTTGASFTQTTTGTVGINATQDITLNTNGDIVLDADGNHVNIKNGGGEDTVTLGLADNGQFTIGAPSLFTIDATGDIVLDAGDSDIIFKRNGTEFARHRMGVSGADLFYRIEYSQGGMELDAAGDITLDAAGDDIKLKDNGAEFGRFSHIGDNQLGIYSNGILAVSFNDSDAVFNSDVNIEDNLDVDGTLNVDGATTLNGHVDLGSNGDDNISVLGKFDTNLRPDATNSYTLGNSDLKWRHAYLEQTLFAKNIDVDSADIGDLNFNGNAITNSGGNLIIDVGGDITLNAGGEDIFFNTGDSAAISWNLGRTNPLTNYIQSHNRHLAIGAHKNMYFDADEGKIFFRDSADADRLRIRFDNQLASGTKLETLGGSLTFDVDGDIVLDADGGDVLLKDGGTQFGRFQNTSGNLIVKSGDTTALTFAGANVTTGGTITPGTTLNTTATDLVGAINELDSDLGNITGLSSFYDGHNQDIVTALNRVAARIVDVYDENGTLLNN